MRIMGTQESQNASGTGTSNVQGAMSLARTVLPDSRHLVLGRSEESDFETTIIDALASLRTFDFSGDNATAPTWLSRTSKTGQTLLHLAALLKFDRLVELLIQKDIPLDMQDINGYTALHFAVLSRSQCCAGQIISAGANVDICTKMGYYRI